MGNSTTRDSGKMVKFPVAVLFLFLCVFGVAASGTAAEKKAEKPAEKPAKEVKKETKEAVVLMPMRATKDIPQDEMTQYEAALVKSLSERYVVYSGQKVLEKVNDVYKRRSAEAKAGKECDETKCLQDVALAFQTKEGYPFVAIANIRKTSGGYSISLTINDVIEEKSVFAEQKPCKGCDEFKVMEVLQTLVGGGSTPPVAAVAPSVSPPVAAQPTPAPTKTTPSGGAAPEGMVYVKQGDGGFYMDKTEVTQEAYQRVIGNNPSEFKGCPTCPVEQVNWDEADAYCGKVGKRLPTEAEWEYAATSGGKKKEWAGTSNEGELGDYAWYDKNSGDKTHPVGGKKPNGLGLYDMSGNVWEWTDSWLDKEQKYRVLRGGAWYDDASHLRAASRSVNTPGTRNGALGFRCSQ